ncbi:MAG: GPR endopeptidase [Bacillota bacterium]|jgi:spore protease|nr:GPR endopeptidase [Bacillota bacterium]NLM08404.1 GPR endopeptidase [Clostridiales Family XIII bacterium]
MNYRTDLAIESKEMIEEKHKGKKVEIPGVEVDEDQYGYGVKVIRIKITTEEGSRIMGKPLGNYITIEAKDLVDGEEEVKQETVKAITAELSKLVRFHNKLNVLVIGLGNEMVTPDSLGPCTVSKVKVTRHMFVITGAESYEDVGCVSALIPGVMYTTGMESAELIRSAVEIAKPEVVIAVDALAARSVDRISSTIQITDTGISPGAGTGNMRKDLTEKSLGTRVIAIGVPTVIDSKTLILDNLAGYLKKPEEAERHIEKNGHSMIVTTTDIDQIIADFSEVIANGINNTLHPGIYSS